MFKQRERVHPAYKMAAKIAKEVKEKNGSLKSLVYEKKRCVKVIYALLINLFKHSTQLEFLLKKSKILEKESLLDPWLVKVLITELLWGKKTLPGKSRPVKIVLAYQQIFNAHTSDVAECLEEVKTVSKPRYVRVNTLLISVTEVVEAFRDEGWTFVRFMNTKDYNGFLEKVANLGPEEFMTDIHIKELLIFPPNTQFYNHSAYKAGLILLQDKASCLPVLLLDPKPDSIVLDMCAAPGMKTSHIASKLENKGTIYAVDLDGKRLKTVDELIKKCGITCVTTINKDVLNIKDRECPNIESILVDPSCSGSGMVDRLDLIERKEVDERRIEKLFGYQVMILKHAFRHFPKVKRVVYSTCSLNAKENEGVIKEVITKCSAFKLLDTRTLMPNWDNFGSDEFGEIGKRCLYAKPERDYTNGFFVAVFERLENGEVNEFLIPKSDYNYSLQNLEKNNRRYNANNEENVSKSKKKRKKNKVQDCQEEIQNKCEKLQNTDNDSGNNNEIDQKHLLKKMKSNHIEVDHDQDSCNNEFTKKKHKKKTSLKDGSQVIPKEAEESAFEIFDNQHETTQIDKKQKTKNCNKIEYSHEENAISKRKKNGSFEAEKSPVEIFDHQHESTPINKKQKTKKSNKTQNAHEEIETEKRKGKENFEEEVKKHHKKDKSMNKSSEELNSQYKPTQEEEADVHQLARNKKKKNKRHSSLTEETGEQETAKKESKDVTIDVEHPQSNKEEGKQLPNDFEKKKKKLKVEDKLEEKDLEQQSEIYESHSDTEARRKRKWRKQLNKENSSIRASLSNFLQTFSSAV